MKYLRSVKQIKEIESYYKLEKELGKGNYGTVYKACNVHTGEKCALKTVSKKSIAELDEKQQGPTFQTLLR